MKLSIKRDLQKGFTLIELLIVVVILGILAAVVIPQLSGATDDARVESLKTNLSAMRSSIALYKQDHGDYPGVKLATGGGGCASGPGEGLARTALAFAEQLTLFTSITGAACSMKSATFKYGPYLTVSTTGVAGIPKNAITEVNTIVFPTTSGNLAMVSATTDSSGGWLYDELTGKFIADDHSGTPFYDSY